MNLARRNVGLMTVVTNLLFLSHNLIHSFNIDTITPVVKLGPVDSYFGFSVAQHSIAAADSGFGPDYVILVGAPRDNSTLKGSSSRVRPGRVYKCSLNSLSDDCTLLNIDDTESSSDLERDDQWLGATVSTQKTKDGMAVVCAPRNKRVDLASVHGPGLCISLTNSLSEKEYLEPCSGRPVDKGHEEFGFCQVGFGLDVAKDGEVLLGAPGVYNWRGMVFQKLLEAPIEVENKWINSHASELVFESSRRKDVAKYYSYLGMSAKIGKINNDRTYVVGAPRSLGIGQVLLFEKIGEELHVDEMHYLTGDQFGSGFGYELVIMDFDFDGMDDLVVGAPFEHGHGIGGAIYAYRNNHKGINKHTIPKKIYSRKMNDSECSALDCRNARFGLALADGGDLDGDGFNDLIVGAPYEKNGAIYIFQGSKFGIKEPYTQRITPQDFGNNLNTFGFSISGGMDMDSNGNPDIVVGAFSSRAAVIFRSRPVINVRAKMTTDPDYIDLKSKDCKGTPCFLLKVCFTLTSNRKNNLKDVKTIEFEIEKESEKKVSRIYFKNRNASAIVSSLSFREENVENCYQQDVFINDQNRDFLNPIIFKLNYWLKNKVMLTVKPGESLPNINDFPILNYADTSLTHAVHFKKNCSNKAQCVSSLKVSGTLVDMEKPWKEFYVIPIGSVKDLLLEVEVHNNDEEAHEAMLFVYLPDKVKFKGTDERGKLYVCQYESSLVTCYIGNPMRGNEMVIFGLRLDPSNLDPYTQNTNITLSVNTTSMEAETQDDTLTLFMKVVILADLEVRGSSSPSEVYFGGVMTGETSIKTEEDVGLEVVHSYEVKNLIESHIRKTFLYVLWPSELNETNVENGKHLLYLMSVQTEGQVTCDLEGSHAINPLEIIPKKSEEVRKITEIRKKRNVEKPTRKFFREGKTGRVAVLDCDDGTLKCSTFICTIEDLKPGQSAVVRFFARLWNTTFLQDFMNVDKIRVYSKAWIAVDPNITLRQISLMNDLSKTMTVVLPDQDLNKPHQVDFWIIILSVCAGVLVLLLLIFLLWKCGFFRRNKPDNLLVHQAKLVNQPVNL